MNTAAAGLSGEDLAELDALVGRALSARDESLLNVVGRGEFTVALG